MANSKGSGWVQSISKRSGWKISPFDSKFHCHVKFWDTIFTLSIHNPYSLSPTSLPKIRFTIWEFTPQPLYNTIVGIHSINRVS